LEIRGEQIFCKGGIEMESMTNKKKQMQEIDRRTFLKVAGATGAAALVGGFPYVVKSAPKEILLGEIHPVTGGMAQSGLEIRAGIEIAVDEINGKGGIKSLGGAKIKLLHSDNQGKPEVAVAEAERMIKEGVTATIGCYSSATTFAATQINEKYKTPFIISLGMSDPILERVFEYIFRPQPDNTIATREILKLIPQLAKDKHTEAKTVALIDEDTLWGASTAKVAKKIAPELGLEIVAAISYDWKTTDLSAEVTKLKAAKADVICPTGYLPDTILLARTMKELKCNAKGVIGIISGGLASEFFVKEVGDAAEYMMCGITWPNPLNPRTIALAREFRKRTGTLLVETGNYGYTAVYVLADALERAGTLDKKAIRDALAATKLTDHILPQEKPIVFDKTGQNINAGIVYTQVQKGVLYSVYPRIYAQKEPIFPVPRWEDRK
jgi:branched-chain amino acid transport system substrate-binding protein